MDSRLGSIPGTRNFRSKLSINSKRTSGKSLRRTASSSVKLSTPDVYRWANVSESISVAAVSGSPRSSSGGFSLRSFVWSLSASR